MFTNLAISSTGAPWYPGGFVSIGYTLPSVNQHVPCIFCFPKKFARESEVEYPMFGHKDSYGCIPITGPGYDIHTSPWFFDGPSIEIDEKWWIFPWRTVSHNQMVYTNQNSWWCPIVYCKLTVSLAVGNPLQDRKSGELMGFHPGGNPSEMVDSRDFAAWNIMKHHETMFFTPWFTPDRPKLSANSLPNEVKGTRIVWMSTPRQAHVKISAVLGFLRRSGRTALLVCLFHDSARKCHVNNCQWGTWQPKS